jgi:hypothetical protein
MNWTISQLDRSMPDGMVVAAHWRVSKTDGAITGAAYGEMRFDYKSPQDPTFIPYANLTQAQVIQWVKDALGPDEVAKYEASVQRQIDAQKAPALTSGLPWSV